MDYTSALQHRFTNFTFGYKRYKCVSHFKMSKEIIVVDCTMSTVVPHRLTVTSKPSWATDTKSGHMRFNTVGTNDVDWIDNRSDGGYAYDSGEDGGDEDAGAFWDSFADDDFEYPNMEEQDVSLLSGDLIPERL